jgi:uncharacterized membrane protein
LLIVIWSVVKRFVIDMPNLAAGTLPEDEFDHRYVERAWVAYLHIVPGALYLFLAPLQLAYRIRSRHYTFHRRLGRVVATAGMISGVFALIFGGLFSFGGLPEASAAVVFGLWFLTCLVLAVRAIRRDDIVHHRRWMIRAFAIGIGIGTIRIWLALLQVGRGGGGIELRSGILDFVPPACGGRRTLATGLSESPRARPRVAGFYPESTPGCCWRTCWVARTGLTGEVAGQISKHAGLRRSENRNTHQIAASLTRNDPTTSRTRPSQMRLDVSAPISDWWDAD